MDFSILLDNVRPIGQGFLPKEKCTPLSEKAYKQIVCRRAMRKKRVSYQMVVC